MKEDTKLAKWLDDSMSDRELEEFRATPEFATYNKIKDFSALLKAPDMNLDAVYASVIEKRNGAKAETKVIRFSPWLARIAAVIILALGLSFFLYTTHTTEQIADAGKRADFLLPDNSEVVLNAGSVASFKAWNWSSNRQMNLDGEAYFKVAKGKTFDVNTSLGKVTVVGTQFNVKARNNRFDVTCFEGKVKVTYNNKQLLLTRGMSIAVEDGKNIAVPASSVQQPGWLSYETSFYAEKPQNVIAELERQYNVTINVKDLSSTQTFNGTLPMNDLDTALEQFTTPYHLKAVKTGKNTIVLSSE